MTVMNTFLGKVFIWILLFAATAVTDWLSAKWTDTSSLLRRANLSTIHEIVGFLAGFTVYTWTRSVWTIIPCALGAWIGSYIAGIDDGLDPAFVEAVHDALLIIQEKALDK